MPNNYVDAMHQLAAESKQTRGITIKDAYGSIIMDDNHKEDGKTENEEPIPVTNKTKTKTKHTEGIWYKGG